MSSSTPSGVIRLGISPCPNDIFLFGAWLTGMLPNAPRAGLRLADVQELNDSARLGRLDVVKVSASLGVSLQDDYDILPSGAAFGLSAGPKLAALPTAREPIEVIAVPGLDTTALALARAALADRNVAAGLGREVSPDVRFTPVRYDLVVEAVRSGKAQAALVIHETAMVLERHGLCPLLDLGAFWRGLAQGLPLPLGVILASKKLPPKTRAGIGAAIAASARLAAARPGLVMPLAKQLAQELDEDILAAHVTAFVGPLSLDMGETGKKALALLGSLVRENSVQAGRPSGSA